jgi:hypothetical protein
LQLKLSKQQKNQESWATQANRPEFWSKSGRQHLRRGAFMGKLVFGMMQSLDGYIAGTPHGPQLPPPGLAIATSMITSAG